MDVERFWRRPGIIAGLESAGLRVYAPDRPRHPPSWPVEARLIAPFLPDGPLVLVGGSNGCSLAIRIATDSPDRIERLILAWPATAGDPDVDARTSSALAELGASVETIDMLLAGSTLRGVADAELRTLNRPVGLIPSIPENPTHQRRTVDRLLRLLPDATELPGSPEPPHPDFDRHRDRLIRAITNMIS